MLLVSILFLPFWISLALIIALSFYFRIFVEGAALALVSDLLYAQSVPKFFEFPYSFFVLTLAVILIVEVLKRRLKFYP